MVESNKILPAAAVGLVAVVIAIASVSALKRIDPWAEKDILTLGMGNPVVWLYQNESEVNSRNWMDFMGRSSRVLHVPFLNLCQETIVKSTQKGQRVEVIAGLSDLAVRLGGWENLPLPLQNPLVEVGPPELNWIRAAVLKKQGGLWVDPATIFLKPLGELPADRIVFFGSDEEETQSGAGGTPVPGLRRIWSPKAEAPLFAEWELKARTRLEKMTGGSEFRRDEKIDLAEAIRLHKSEIEIRPNEELTRKGKQGRRIEVEDLLASGGEGRLPFVIPPTAVTIPIPWPEVKQRRAFGWFLRMSEDQILESDLAVSALFKKALS